MGEDARRHRHIVETFREVAELYAFREIATPIFEFTDVFERTLGDTSDVVTKEMYTFVDRGGEQLTLRPEMTAGVARAFISNGLAQDLPIKFFGHGPMFRYERPQKGRMRQFHQIDAEILGVPEPQADIEVIALAHHVLSALGLGDKITLELNSLGDVESRLAYRARLIDYFSAHRAALSEDSRMRLERNPLRILDSKAAEDRPIVEAAPAIAESFNAASREFFDAVRRGLDALGIGYAVNPRLVRGLDYYSHTAFEFTTTHIGAQGTVLGGGRYDGLIETMGGPATAGIGWAAGIERLALMVTPPPESRDLIAVVPVGDDPAVQAAALALANRLRRAGHAVDQGYRGNVGKRMKRADKLGASRALILGESELAAGIVQLRDLATGEQRSLPLDAVEAAFA